MLDIDELVFSPPELGCVLYLPGHPGGGSKIFDCSPYGNHGTITGATWERTVGGLWCLSFDGADDVVALPIALDSYSRWAVELWAYLKTGLADKGIWGYGGNNTLYFNGADALTSYWGGALVAFGDIRRDAWNHLVLQRNGSSWEGYTNGKLDGTATNGNTTGSATLYLGGQGNASWGNTKQALVRIYNRTMTALEIQSHFSQAKYLFGVW